MGTVAHPDVYLLRAVAHNWGDEKVIEYVYHVVSLVSSRFFPAPVVISLSALFRMLQVELLPILLPHATQTQHSIADIVPFPRLLKLLRSSAGPNTKLLWVDNMLAYACVDEESGKGGSEAFGAVRSLVPEGSPLLPNLGRASSNGYILDIQASPSLKSDLVHSAWLTPGLAL